MIPDHRKTTSGVKDPKLDCFADVDRALTIYLYTHDPAFRARSDHQRSINQYANGRTIYDPGTTVAKAGVDEEVCGSDQSP